MEELSTFWKVFIGICAALITIGGATAVISRWLTPFKDLKNRVSKLENEIETVKKNEHDFDETVQSLKVGIDCMCRGLLGMIDHELDGNNTDILKKTKDDIYSYIIDRK